MRLYLLSACVSATFSKGSHVSSPPLHLTRNSRPPSSSVLWLQISSTSYSSPSRLSTAEGVRGLPHGCGAPREGLVLSLAWYLTAMVSGERPGNCLAIVSRDSPCSFSRRIFASSYGVYLILLGVGLEFAVVSLSFVDLMLLCLAERCLLAVEAELRFSVTWYPFPCFPHGSQVNCSWKVGIPSNVTRFKTAFLSGHSSNFATGALIVSSSRTDPCEGGRMGMLRRLRRFGGRDDL